MVESPESIKKIKTSADRDTHFLRLDWFWQSRPQHTGGYLQCDSSCWVALIPTILITSELKYVSSKDLISPQNQHCPCWVWGPRGSFIKWTRICPTAPHHGGSGHLITVAGSGLAAVVPPARKVQTKMPPATDGNLRHKQEMMNIRCAIVAPVGHRLKTSDYESPPWFQARGAWPHIINVGSVNRDYSRGRGLKFGTGLKARDHLIREICRHGELFMMEQPLKSS